MEFVLGLVDADDLGLAVLPPLTIKNKLGLLAHRNLNGCNRRHVRRNERGRGGGLRGGLGQTATDRT